MSISSWKDGWCKKFYPLPNGDIYAHYCITIYGDATGGTVMFYLRSINATTHSELVKDGYHMFLKKLWFSTTDLSNHPCGLYFFAYNFKPMGSINCSMELPLGKSMGATMLQGSMNAYEPDGHYLGITNPDMSIEATFLPNTNLKSYQIVWEFLMRKR